MGWDNHSGVDDGNKDEMDYEKAYEDLYDAERKKVEILEKEIRELRNLDPFALEEREHLSKEKKNMFGDVQSRPPSPEARVDWEKEAEKILPLIPILIQRVGEKVYVDDNQYDEKSLMNQQIILDRKLVSKALSTAFEKGREAR